MGADDRYASLKARIRAIYDHHKGRYGYRRITAVLRQAGETINHKTVQRLMQQLGLKSLVRPKRYRAYRGAEGYAAPNTLQRRFQAQRPHQRWVTDITEFKVNGQKLYLSPCQATSESDPLYGLIAPASTLAANASLATAYLLKDQLKTLWFADDEATARSAWQEWHDMATSSGIEALSHFAKRLAPYLEGILSSTRHRLNTSVQEGMNNRIKVIKRMAYGYRDTAYFFLKIRAAFPGKVQ